MERKLRLANQAQPYSLEPPRQVQAYNSEPIVRSDFRAGYLANRNRAMISVDQGKERIFGIGDATSNAGDDDRKLGKRIMTRHQDTKLF